MFYMYIGALQMPMMMTNQYKLLETRLRLWLRNTWTV